MLEAIIIATIGLVGTVIVEVLRRFFNNRQIQRQEMLDEMRALKAQVKELQDSLDEWKTKYYQLLMQISNKQNAS
ncbi:hypothetical protein [Rhodococcus sp. PvP104]|uniref:hypothetical protein n=1 Tax=Rhodococcus sp. PvP104 TaxID=2817911 RepID=UPI001AE7394E|nr:hypothetical protein [Rhodococcus sp. PvP104]MBP2522788.1 uncharacterized membrane-anchored protein YhcB (DUF1043 family) [Rhodococcus sp. PvP104]